MLMGAAIGAVAGLVIYFIQQQQKKKQEAANTTLDSDAKENTDSSEQ